MSGFDDESLSLESLFAFVNGPSAHSGEEDAPEAPEPSQEIAEGDAAACADEPERAGRAVEAAVERTDEAACAPEGEAPAILPDAPAGDDVGRDAGGEGDVRAVDRGPSAAEPEVEPTAEPAAVPSAEPAAEPEVAPAPAPVLDGVDLGILALVASTPAGLASAPAPDAVDLSLLLNAPEPGAHPAPASERRPEGARTVAGPDAAVERPEPPVPSSEAVGGRARAERIEPVRGKHAADHRALDRVPRGKHASDEKPAAVAPVVPIEGGAGPAAAAAPEAAAGTSAESPLSSASIDERLELLIQKRLDEIRESVDATAPSASVRPPTAPAVDAAAAPEREQSQKGRPAAEERPAKEQPAKEQPVKEEARKEPGGDEKPDLSSEIFDEPPQSIREGMLKADELHKRTFILKAGAIAAASLLCVGLTVFGASQIAPMMEASDDSTTAPIEDDAGADDRTPPVEDAPSADADQAKPKEEQRDLSGTVVYRYTTPDASGEERTTTETVAFGQDGLCVTSTLEVTLSDADAVEEFLSELERDYGPSYREGEAQGSNARVVLDVSANKLDRERYEDELRVSVEDLAIVKKS